jgi:DNA-binding response OmpR family regulator
MSLCPCCRQPLPDRPAISVSLDSNHAVARGHFVELEPDMACVLDALAKSWPNSVAYERLIFAIWGCASPQYALNTLRVHITRIRKVIAPLGYNVVVVWGEGYRLVDSGVPVKRPKVVFAGARA